MEKQKFNLADFKLGTRIQRLSEVKGRALAEAVERIGGLEFSPAFPTGLAGGNRGQKREVWLEFLFPLAEFGLDVDQMFGLAAKVPEGFPIDHRQIYFDFRLDRWMKHIEPPTIAESLDEYLENAESTTQGIAFLKAQWQAFLERHGQV